MEEILFFDGKELLFVTIWAALGGILGFFSFRFKSSNSLAENVRSCIVSVGTGILFGLPLCVYLIESKHFSQPFSVLLCGLGSFGIPDLVVKAYPMLEALAMKFVKNKAEKIVGEDK